MTIGSLFDGSGGFPLAFAMCGGEPVWRSEVEPYPIRVTRSRFPGMMHLGDVQKVNGAKIKPVDVMTFGSPCQDLSVAGKRAGLKHTENGDEETTRSGLFMEPIRIIKEMRYATDGLYPTFAVWENVPGAFSSNKGEDFRVVLEELARIKGGAEITIPKSDKWQKAGCIEGDGWSIAWRTVDAQYWGVAQRRRRIYLVADFGGQRAAEILFEREGLRGYFEKGGKTWQTAAACAETGTGTDDKCIAYAFEPGAASRLGGYVNENTTGTLRAEMGDNQVAVAYGIQRQLSGVEVHKDLAPTILAAAGESGNNKPLVAYGVDCYNQSMTGDKAKSLGTGSDADNVPCVIRIENHPADSRVNIDESGKCQTLTGRMGTGGGNVPMVMHYGFPLGFRPENVKLYEECATTLCNGTRAGFTTGVVYAVDQGGGKSSVTVMEDTAPTLTCTHDGAPAVCAEDRTYQKVTGPLMANSHPGGYTGQDAYSDMLITEKADRHYVVRRLTPTECARLQGFPDKWGHPDKKESLTDEEYSFWQEVRDTYAEINGKKKKQYSRENMLKWYNKLHTDSSEYKMWGNGIALPNALYVMQGIAKRLKEGAEDGKQRID